MLSTGIFGWSSTSRNRQHALLIHFDAGMMHCVIVLVGALIFFNGPHCFLLLRCVLLFCFHVGELTQQQGPSVYVSFPTSISATSTAFPTTSSTSPTSSNSQPSSPSSAVDYDHLMMRDLPSVFVCRRSECDIARCRAVLFRAGTEFFKELMKRHPALKQDRDRFLKTASKRNRRHNKVSSTR
jgi:hypothetical protein